MGAHCGEVVLIAEPAERCSAKDSQNSQQFREAMLRQQRRGLGILKTLPLGDDIGRFDDTDDALLNQPSQRRLLLQFLVTLFHEMIKFDPECLGLPHFQNLGLGRIQATEFAQGQVVRSTRPHIAELAVL